MSSAAFVGLASMLAVMALFAGVSVTAGRQGHLAARLDAYVGWPRQRNDLLSSSRQGLGRLLARLDRLLSEQGPTQRLALSLAQANVQLTVPEFLGIVLLAGTLGGLLGFALQQQAISAVGGAALALALPWIWLERKREKRLGAFHDQLVDVLVLMVGSLRSGHGLLNALDLVSKELSAPASEEFARVLREVGFGLSQMDALNNLVRRMETSDLQLVVTAVNISSEAGGNLSHVLEKITETLRERVQLRGEIRVLTTQQRLTTYLLVALPLILGALLSLINPGWMLRLFQPGWIRLVPLGAGVAEVLGFIVTRRLTRIEV